MQHDVSGTVIIQRLHRMVRQGYRPWLGYDAASGGDRDIQLRRRDNAASIGPDGAVTFATPVALATPGPDGQVRRGLVVPPADAASFDALFPPGAPNRRNLVRRLYEIGVGAW